jgi:hypothetical protein
MDQQQQRRSEPPILESDLNGVKRLTMNRPQRLNAWDAEMLRALYAHLDKATNDSNTKGMEQLFFLLPSLTLTFSMQSLTHSFFFNHPNTPFTMPSV